MTRCWCPLLPRLGALLVAWLWLDWDLLEGRPAEQRLSILCYWVLVLDKKQQPYGMKLPGLTLPPDTGDTHRLRALDALAAWPEFG